MRRPVAKQISFKSQSSSSSLQSSGALSSSRSFRQRLFGGPSQSSAITCHFKRDVGSILNSFSNEVDEKTQKPKVRSLFDLLDSDENEIFSFEFFSGLVCNVPVLPAAELDIFLKLKFEQLWVDSFSDLHGLYPGSAAAGAGRRAGAGGASRSAMWGR